MEKKDIGKIRKNEITDIVVQIDDFGGRAGVTIREFSNSDRYTGFTKSGTRIPAESFSEFKELINSVDEKELMSMHESAKKSQPQNQFKEKSFQKKISDNQSNQSEVSEEIEEEVFWNF